MPPCIYRFIALATTVVALTGVSVARADSSSASPDSADSTDSARWGFYFNLGVGANRGDFHPTLEKPLTGEFGILRARGQWRYGIGVSFSSFVMPAPYDKEKEWAFQEVFLTGARVFRPGTNLQPYLQARVGLARLHPRSELFAMDPLPADFKVGDSPTKASNGFSVGFVPGLEWKLTRDFSVDASVLFDFYKVDDTNLAAVGAGSASSGQNVVARLGVRWWEAPPGVPVLRDAWGARTSYVWAIGEVSAINFGASAVNEYVRNVNFAQINPRSWWKNLGTGFTYDDNDFETNQYIHPFDGSTYYNAARANGVSFWPAYAITIGGSLQWELMGETHPMSKNDLISTGIGGAIVGETMYRFSSMMLDNQATGARRFFRESGAFLVDPIRGLNRVVSGRAWSTDYANPADSMDTNPRWQQNDLAVGYRRVGKGNSLEHDYSNTGYLNYRHDHGDIFENPWRRPFDYYWFEGQLNFGDKKPLGRVIIKGNLWTAPVGDVKPVRHMLAAVQFFDYVNNNAYEFGGQSLGFSLFSRWGKWGDISAETRLDAMGTILGAVNSNFADSANVADQERNREYDFGPGGSAAAKLEIMHR
ncbi:MAG TPA: DUF3943 domain-containing protein, partial [Candidatus Krumholzibacteria bacterium]|nr:DUF3943 domain-containing protein [Candidatus Krumholzibacteria bacterium]